MRVNLPLLAAQITGMFLVFAAVLFTAAGTTAWPAGWAFLLLFFGFVVGLTVWLLRYNPSLLTERMTGIGKSDQKTWDKVFFVLLNVLFITWLVVMPLDAVRFNWSNVPAALQIVGALALVLSFYFFYRTFKENAYLSPAVRIQSDRGQHVVTTGPYHYVRHPMYAAATIFLVSTSLLLGSWLGVLAALALILAIAFRATREEQTLSQELPGYADYMAQVRYRLVPHVW
ncbi:MAG TPA: isoprenylcysteine carboxylmethyltransferase family protein [Chloroflexota bacterium]|nr:isoprenylcysteine carboxylmethyltransferase family protein [Chloroflexota bacterium]